MAKKITLPNTNEIVAFMHCGLCLESIPEGVSPREWTQNEAGWTKEGFQVWCTRHEVNVMHIHFEGMKHPANTTRKLSPLEAAQIN